MTGGFGGNDAGQRNGNAQVNINGGLRVFQNALYKIQNHLLVRAAVTALAATEGLNGHGQFDKMIPGAGDVGETGEGIGTAQLLVGIGLDGSPGADDPEVVTEAGVSAEADKDPDDGALLCLEQGNAVLILVGGEGVVLYIRHHARYADAAVIHNIQQRPQVMG